MISGYFALLVFWTAFEFLHHNWSLRWPWLTLGNGFAHSVKIIQWYEFTGVLGGSVWILLCNILIFTTIKTIKLKFFPNSIKFAFFTLLLVLIPVIVSLLQYSHFRENGPSCKVVVLQPNIDPYTEKFSGMNAESQVTKLLALADKAVSDSTDFVIAPETSLPICWEDSLTNQNIALKPVSDFLQKFPAIGFVAGAITNRKLKAGEILSQTARLSAGNIYYDEFNSALLFRRNSGTQISHKSILVSGVERMPFQEYFYFLRKYLIDLGGASGSLAAANEPEVFSEHGKMKIGPVICFESVFGWQSAALVKKGANILFVLTNDGWWKESTGAWQHFDYSQLRAIETRRSIARSANTGISGFINQRGDILQKIKTNTCGTISASLKLNDSLTFYARNGDYIGFVSLIFSGMIVIYLIFFCWKNRG
jgi:apolipoprotein N-acyltransferase